MDICRKPTLVAALGLLVCASCSAQPAAQDAPAPTPAATAAPVASNDANVVTGTVLETMDASSYTYVRVKIADGEIWAAASHFDVAVGDQVTIPLDMPMESFHSDALKRDFPLIYFASHIERNGTPSTSAKPALPAGHPPIGGAMPAHGTAAAAPQGSTAPIEPVARAEGGLTVAEVWSQRQGLAGTSVTVHGRVAKLNVGIMGRNWIHLQDGSGSRTDGTHDLTVTSDATTQVGAVVTVNGTVVVDRDFGAGYRYAVLLENATVTPD